MRLSTREKSIVVSGGVFLGVLVLWLGIWEPVRAHQDLLERKVSVKRTEYREVTGLAERYRDLQARIDEIEAQLRRSKGFSILSYLESLAKRQRVQDKIVQMKPRPGETTKYYRENGVEIRMERIPLEDLVRYLYEVENSPELLRVKQLQVRPRFDNPNLLDVRFQVSAYEPLEEA